MLKRKELEKIKALSSAGLTEKQMSVRLFCSTCHIWKTKLRFTKDGSKDSGHCPQCKLCDREAKKKRNFHKRLLSKEIYVEGASKPVVDRMVGGRGLVSKASLASFLQVSERTVNRLQANGEIQGYNFLGYLYFRQEDVESWLEKKLGEKIDTTDLIILE